MVRKKMKYANIAGVGLMAISLVACASEQEVAVLGDSEQTQKIMQQSGIQTIEQSQFYEKCKEYELQPDGSYVCDNDDDDYSSSGTGMFWFFNGHTYSSHNAMVTSSDYKKNNLSTGTNTKKSSSSKNATKNNSKTNVNTNKNGTSSNSSKSSSSGGKSSGFGSGARGGSSGGS